MPTFHTALTVFATEVTTKFGLLIDAQEEEQLKSPVEQLLRAAGDLLTLDVKTVGETRAETKGRPDVGVAKDRLLVGYVELKAPGKGADTRKFRGHDKQQWEKFKDIPNILYTDGNEWALYHNGKLTEKLIRLPGNITTDGTNAVDTEAASALFELLRNFLQWEPISPASPKNLAEMLAPVCRLLRKDVLAALEDPLSNLSTLAQDWRSALFPDADNKQFADAYAQTLTYALLLARLSGESELTVSEAARSLRKGHQLLAEALKVLGDDDAREQIEMPVRLIERLIGAVSKERLTRNDQQDPWLYFYEDFLAAYDPAMRKKRGVYYTPVQVVQAQVRLVAELLDARFDAKDTFADGKIVTLDPATGTGTYLLAAVKHGLEQIENLKGVGARVGAATKMAANMHAFEILVGPYAVAHLRLTQQLLAEGGTLPNDGVHVYLNDTLESPFAEAPERLSLNLKKLGDEHKRAQKVKADTAVVVCIGNPPYNRQNIRIEEQVSERRKGGWVRFGEGNNRPDEKILLDDFLAPLNAAGLGVHAKNLFNDYVYFWRWALWKVFEQSTTNGIVSFITAASYLRGPGFGGMRQVMRETFEELWIIDLEGGNLGTRKTENVFAIQTPVCIAVGVRSGQVDPKTPATVHYTRLEGTREAKLDTLAKVTSFADLTWSTAPTGWMDSFETKPSSPFFDWPLLTDLFPWQENGFQFARSWPIGETPEVLQRRWKTLLSAPNRKILFSESRDRKIHKQYPSLDGSETKAPAIISLSANAPQPTLMSTAFRSFDRQWIIADSRVGDFLRPVLHRTYSEKQIFMTSLLTEVLGEGPSAVATSLIPDYHHFRGSFGGAHVIPLWRDKEGKEANITTGVLDVLAETYGISVSSEDFFAYCYGVLATPDYVRRFWNELRTPGPHIPVPRGSAAFTAMMQHGRYLLWVHTYGERFVPEGKRKGRVPTGLARIKVGTPTSATDYPEKFSYDESTQELSVGCGVFGHVRQEVWKYCVSGLEVVKSWLGYRMKKRTGKSSSPLDTIRPETWAFDDELLDLLWVLDATVDRLPQVTQQFETILTSELFRATDFPSVKEMERFAPRMSAKWTGLLMFDMEEEEIFENELEIEEELEELLSVA